MSRYFELGDDMCSVKVSKVNRDERGFTMIESLMALLFLTLFIVIMLSMVYLGVSRVANADVDGRMLRFEQNVVKHIEQDYRGNRILSIGEGDLSDEKLVFVVEDAEGAQKTIRYENRSQGFYRVDGDKSFLISSVWVNQVIISEGSLEIYYMLDGFEKILQVGLVK